MKSKALPKFIPHALRQPHLTLLFLVLLVVASMSLNIIGLNCSKVMYQLYVVSTAFLLGALTRYNQMNQLIRERAEPRNPDLPHVVQDISPFLHIPLLLNLGLQSYLRVTKGVKRKTLSWLKLTFYLVLELMRVIIIKLK